MRSISGASKRKIANDRLERDRTDQQRRRLELVVVAHQGVYFPNRAHHVRIEAKRLRYLVEIAAATDRRGLDHDLKILKHVQSVLGHLHDREVLLLRLGHAPADETGALDAVRRVLIAERDRLFDEYLSHRDDLRRVWESRVSAARTRSGHWVRMAGALAMPPVFVAIVLAQGSGRRLRPRVAE